MDTLPMVRIRSTKEVVVVAVWVGSGGSGGSGGGRR